MKGDPRICCWRCTPDYFGMMLCVECGNKRCPKATNHDHACSGSNEPGQIGSVYGVTDSAGVPNVTLPLDDGEDTQEAMLAIEAAQMARIDEDFVSFPDYKEST